MHLKAFVALGLLPALLSARGLPDRRSVICSFGTAASNGDTCKSLAEGWGLTEEQFKSFNPAANCASLVGGKSYCVVGTVSTATTSLSSSTSKRPAPTPKSPSSESVPEPTPTKPSNGITTPIPTQPDMVSNCNSFHFVKKGEGCALIASQNGITLAQFQEWNPSSGKDCTSLWAESFACVSIIGNEPSPTEPDNGIKTPSPMQPDIVKDCNKFHFVKPGQTCGDIASDNGLALDDFVAWNPKAGGTGCAGLWANAYACISVIGYDNFNDGNMDGWMVYDGSYDAASKALVAGKSSGGKALFNAQFTDFTFHADISFPSAGGNAGLVFRASKAGKGADNYRGYYAGIDSDGSVFLGRANNDWTRLAGTKAGSVCCRNYHMMIRANGDLFTIYVDDMSRPLLEVRDSTYRSGTNGVRVYQTGATFDNIRIIPAKVDNFSTGKLIGWTVYDGTFDAWSRALIASSSSSGKALLNDYFTDFIFEADIDFPNPGTRAGNAGLVFRASSPGSGADNYSGYYAGIGLDGSVVLGRANGGWRELSRVEANIRPGPHHIMVRASGDALAVYVNDMRSPKIDLKDNTYSGGMNGVRIFQTGATYNNIRIFHL